MRCQEAVVEYEILKAPEGVRGASGVVRHGDDLLIVSDDSPGCYFRVHILDQAEPLIRIPDEAAEQHELLRGSSSALGVAFDLESIDLLADGRIVVLSERLRSILDDQGIVAQYDDPFAELAERGLEGLAVRPIDQNRSRVAVLWEGGYLDESELPGQLRDLAGRALNPSVFVHDLDLGAKRVKARVKNASTIVELLAPSPEAGPSGAGVPPLRFRAPDLVWHKWTRFSGMREWGFIVLLNSETPPYKPPGTSEEPKKQYGPRWLQRFNMTGEPVGSALDLDTTLQEVLKTDELVDANWEGIAWFEPGKRVVLVHDEGGAKLAYPVAVILSIPQEWQT
jgi:hypothetical protein